MRTLEDHKVNPANDKIKIEVTDEPGAGGANHRYVISGFHLATNVSALPEDMSSRSRVALIFQNGPIPEMGVNGVTQEVLLSIVADRLRCFQAGKFANKYNEDALTHIELALESLLARTKERMEREVEGTHAI